jgi:hypothetical protein
MSKISSSITEKVSREQVPGTTRSPGTVDVDAKSVIDDGKSLTRAGFGVMRAAASCIDDASPPASMKEFVSSTTQIPSSKPLFVSRERLQAASTSIATCIDGGIRACSGGNCVSSAGYCGT